MTTTETLPDVEVELTGSELVTHLSCAICYPVVVPFETYALCGVRLAGIERPYGSPIDCEICADLDVEKCYECGF